MNHYSDKYYNLFFVVTLILTMLVGIILSMIYSKSFKKKIFKNMDTSKNSYLQYSENSLEKNSFLLELEFHNYPENSVPIKMTLGKIEKVEKPYQPRLNLSFLENNNVNDNTFNILKFRYNMKQKVNYENF